LLSNAAFAPLTDAQKQEIAEIFIYNQIVQDENYTNALKRREHRHSSAAGERFSDEISQRNARGPAPIRSNGAWFRSARLIRDGINRVQQKQSSGP
jgi:hypothetical protein